MTTQEIARLHPTIAKRVTIEHRIVRKIAQRVFADGGRVFLNDYETGERAEYGTWKALAPDIAASECETLGITLPDGNGGYTIPGGVLLVWGNGEYVVTDWDLAVEKYVTGEGA